MKLRETLAAYPAIATVHVPSGSSSRANDLYRKNPSRQYGFGNYSNYTDSRMATFRDFGYPAKHINEHNTGQEFDSRAIEVANGNTAIGELVLVFSAIRTFTRQEEERVHTGRFLKRSHAVTRTTRYDGQATIGDFTDTDDKTPATVLGYQTLHTERIREELGLHDTNRDTLRSLERSHVDRLGRTGVMPRLASIVPISVAHEVVDTLREDPSQIREFVHALHDISGASAVEIRRPLTPTYETWPELGVTKALIRDVTRDGYDAVVDMV